MISAFELKWVFAFEPDDVARAKAEILLEPYLGKVVSLSSLGLSDITGEARLTKNVSFGDGSSQVRKISSDILDEMSSISLTRLDDVKIDRDSGGLLWLDVEGHAVQALAGAVATLPAIDIAKIEIQMHDMSETRKSDAFKVIEICQNAGLMPIYFPMYPGYFGDIVFIRAEKLSHLHRFFAFTSFILFQILHKGIYPRIGKPSVST